MLLIRVFHEGLVVEAPLDLILLYALKQDLLTINLPLFHDALQIVRLILYQILIVCKVGELCLAFVYKEVPLVPHVIARNVQQRSVLSRFDEAGPHEHIVCIGLLFR